MYAIKNPHSDDSVRGEWFLLLKLRSLECLQRALSVLDCILVSPEAAVLGIASSPPLGFNVRPLICCDTADCVCASSFQNEQQAWIYSPGDYCVWQ
jgi:hypothetical protein